MCVYIKKCKYYIRYINIHIGLVYRHASISYIHTNIDYIEVYMLHIAALNYAFVYRQVAVRGYDKFDGKGTTFMGTNIA